MVQTHYQQLKKQNQSTLSLVVPTATSLSSKILNFKM